MNSNFRPAPFVLLSSGHGTLIVNRNDHHMGDTDRGFGVGYQLFKSSYYEPKEISLALTLLSLRLEHFGAGVVAIDCGANIGIHTIEWAKFMHGWGEVISVEAQERIFYALAGNVAINNCFNVKAMHAAAGAVQGTIDIPQPDYLTPSSFGSLELRKSDRNEFIGQKIDYEASNCQTIPLISIDSLDLKRLDFLKIDVEGMELEVLAGAKSSIAKFKPILLIETIKTDQLLLTKELDALGYRYIQFGINAVPIHASDPCLEKLISL